MKLRLFLSMLVGVLLIGQVQAQESIPKTNSIDPNTKVNKKKERPARERYMSIIKTNTKGILYGNKCFEDFTSSIGFVYEVQIKGQPGSLNGFARFWHNAAVKTALVVSAWPWWKARVNKKKKDCRKLSGDFVG